MIVESIQPIHCIDRRYDSPETVVVKKRLIVHQCMQYRGRISQARRLDDDTVQRLDLTALLATVRSPSVEIRSPRTVQQTQPLLTRTKFSSDFLDQLVIEPDLSKLVDDDGSSPQG